MLNENFNDNRLPIYTEPVHREMNMNAFVWIAAAVHRIWEIQNEADPKFQSISRYSLYDIALAHSRWIEKNPKCTEMLFEAVAEAQRSTQGGMKIPPTVSAYLSAVYKELYEIIRTEIWRCNDDNH